MSTQNKIFKKVEVVGATEAEALAKAPFETYMKNATQAYNIWKKKQTGGITEKEVKQFCVDYLAKNTKDAAGVGCYIVVESPVVDSRERPYKIVNIKGEGTRKFGSFYVAKDVETGQEIVKCEGTKAEALNEVKEMYKSGAYKGHFKMHKIKEVIDGQSVVAEGWYTPSKGSHVGTYICFGMVEA